MFLQVVHLQFTKSMGFQSEITVLLRIYFAHGPLIILELIFIFKHLIKVIKNAFKLYIYFEKNILDHPNPRNKQGGPCAQQGSALHAH